MDNKNYHKQLSSIENNTEMKNNDFPSPIEFIHKKRSTTAK